MVDTIFIVQRHHWHYEDSEHDVLGIVRSATEARRLIIKTVAEYLEDDGEELMDQARTIDTDTLWQQLIESRTVTNNRNPEKGGTWAISQESDDGNVYYFEKHQITHIPPLSETPKLTKTKPPGKAGAKGPSTKEKSGKNLSKTTINKEKPSSTTEYAEDDDEEYVDDNE